MKTLLTIKPQTFDSTLNTSLPLTQSREAARGVIMTEGGQVYLLKVGRYDFHKLPGGGIHEGESAEKAFRRECVEEIGCKITKIKKLGKIVEHRDFEGLKQTSYCYLAMQSGSKQHNTLEVEEINDQMSEILVNNIDSAIDLLSNDNPKKYRRKICPTS